MINKKNRGNENNYKNPQNILIRKTIKISLESENICNDIAHPANDSWWRMMVEEREKLKRMAGKRGKAVKPHLKLQLSQNNIISDWEASDEVAKTFFSLELGNIDARLYPIRHVLYDSDTYRTFELLDYTILWKKVKYVLQSYF